MKRKERKEQEKLHNGTRLVELEDEIEVIKKEIEKQKLLNELEALKQEGRKNSQETIPPITFPVYPREDKPLQPYFDPNWYKKGPWCGNGMFTTIETKYEVTEPLSKKGGTYAKKRKN